MATNSSAIQAQQLNPLTPMAFLAPDAAYEATVAAYVMVGSVGALIWDILMHIDSDYQLLFRHKITVPTVTYFLSRTSVLVYVLMNVIFQTAALPNCQVIKKTVCVLYHVAFSSTSLLFFLRIRAVFNRDRIIVAVFFVLWLGVLGGSLTVATVGNAVHLGPTRYCRATALKAYASAAPITFAVNDTFVFLAISWRLLTHAAVDPKRKPSFTSMFFGKYLPAFTRAVLQDGQVYYLVSVTSNLVVAIITWTRAVPLAYRLMFTVFNVALTNMMACRVYRHTKFGDFREKTISTRWIISQLGRLDVEAGLGQKPLPVQFAGSHHADTDAFESNIDSHVTPIREVGIAQKVSPIDAGDVHRIEKLQFAKTEETVDSSAR